MEQLTIHQEYLVEIIVYKGFKIRLGVEGYETYYKEDYDSYAIGDVSFIKGNQKTLSSTNKTKVRMVCYHPANEMGSLNKDDYYYVCDTDENEYVAFGKVLEVIKRG